MVGTILCTTLPFAAVALVAWVVWCNAQNEYRGCCPAPEDGKPWTCAHGKHWVQGIGHVWRRVRTRTYVRFATEGLDEAYGELCRGPVR